jgi:hypothetical protein
MTSVAYGLAFPATRGVLAFHPAVGSFDPTSLFSGETGGWWDPSDMSALFQDSAGTTPVTAADQPVGRIEDKSGNGNHLLQATSTERPYLRTDGTYWWLEFDGVDDFLQAIFTHAQPFTRITAMQLVSYPGSERILDGGSAYAETVSQPSDGIGIGSSTPNIVVTGFTVGNSHVVTEIWDGASSKLAVDNGTYGTGDPGTDTPNGLTVGSDHNGNFAPNILWFGMISIGSVLDSTGIANCRTFFGAKAGLSL